MLNMFRDIVTQHQINLIIMNKIKTPPLIGGAKAFKFSKISQ